MNEATEHVHILVDQSAGVYSLIATEAEYRDLAERHPVLPPAWSWHHLPADFNELHPIAQVIRRLCPSCSWSEEPRTALERAYRYAWSYVSFFDQVAAGRPGPVSGKTPTAEDLERSFGRSSEPAGWERMVYELVGGRGRRA